MSDTEAQAPAQKAPSSSTDVSFYDTPAPIFDALARVFEVKDTPRSTGGTHRWVTLRQDGVTVTFHATDEGSC